MVAEMDSESSSSFTCVATGAPLLQVSWFRGETNLTSTNYEISELSNGTRIMSVLTINNPTYKDSGDYSCVATILDDKTGDPEFTAYSNTTLSLTVIGKQPKVNLLKFINQRENNTPNFGFYAS